MNNLPPSTPVLSNLDVSGETLKINEISMHIQYTNKSLKLYLKTSQSVQNEAPRGTWSHQNNENVEKVKFHENINIYYTFDWLGHQKSADVLSTNLQKSCLQSKHLFWCFKWREISKSDPTWSPKGDPESTKNPFWDLPGSLCVHLWPTWLQNGAKIVPKDLQMVPKLSSWDPEWN